MVILWNECKNCKKKAGALLLLGFTSGLGPETLLCPKCGERFPSNRTDWRQKSWIGKTIYFGMSLFYIAAVGIVGAVFTATSLRFIREGVRVPEYPLDAWVKFWPYGIPFAAAVLILQVLRVRWSIRRSPDGKPAEFRASPWSIHCNAQGLVLMSMLILPGIAWLAGFLLHLKAP